MEPVGYEDRPPDELDATFAALADPTRRAILARLAGGDATVTELAAPFAMSQPAVSKHLRVLERAGLVSRHGAGRRRPCRLDARPLRRASEWVEGYRSFWEARYQQLDTLLAELQAPGDDRPAPDAGAGEP
jgi:DNA-binding transcriptional ArsR family regulator